MGLLHAVSPTQQGTCLYIQFIHCILQAYYVYSPVLGTAGTPGLRSISCLLLFALFKDWTYNRVAEYMQSKVLGVPQDDGQNAHASQRVEESHEV